jgi:hypothetical protein
MVERSSNIVGSQSGHVSPSVSQPICGVNDDVSMSVADKDHYRPPTFRSACLVVFALFLVMAALLFSPVLPLLCLFR